MIQRQGIQRHGYEAWKSFIDQLEKYNADVYLSLWMQVDRDPTEKYQDWRQLVQGAFFAGYEAGFTDRLFKGDNK